MITVSSPQDLIDTDVYLDMEALVGRRLHLKCEGMNFGGSVKMRTAVAMVAAAERNAPLDRDSVLIESSSGNLGLALSIIAANRRLRFTCVTDRTCNQRAAATIRALGADLVVIEQPDPVGGYLRARLDWVRRACAGDSRYIWLNQYTNQANWIAHYEGTAPSILKHSPDLDVLFVGVGTGGTAMGCARFFRDNASSVRVVAVDAVGSVSFGHPPARRLIPGLGAGVRPPLLDSTVFDDVVHVAESDTIRTCRLLASHGMLFGGSTGAVVCGALRWLDRHDPKRSQRSVCIAPDMGERYVDTVYDDAWVTEHFGQHALVPLSVSRD